MTNEYKPIEGISISETVKPIFEENLLGKIFTEIIARTDDGVITVNENQQIVNNIEVTKFNTRVNHGAEEIFGYSSSELLNKPLSMLIPASSQLSHIDHVEKFKNGHQTHCIMKGRDDAVIIAYTKEGEQFYAEITLTKIMITGHLLMSAMIHKISSDTIQEVKEFNRNQKYRKETKADLLKEVIEVNSIKLDDK